MTDQPKDDPQAVEQPKDEPKVITCLRCGGAMFQARIKGDNSIRYMTSYQFALEPLDKGVFDGRESYVIPLVCGNCGYTELRATDIKALKPYKH